MARARIYAKRPEGKLYQYRQVMGYSLLAFLAIAPFIRIQGEPFLLFNIVERKFVILGSVFWPQDLYIFVFGMLILMVCIVLFTVIYGRIWCGWACPQTIFLELMFRRIEYWIEGDAAQQKKLDQSPNSIGKIMKKGAKHGLFFLVSFFISNLFLAYIIGTDQLLQIMTDPLTAHPSGLAAILLFTGVFYGVFAYVREIVCTTICPYGRLQGVLLDDQSISVAYDPLRGEPRGKRQRFGEASPHGDCVDCGLCVQVCPTGIDIRNGIQLECVNCTACIDACDAVMEKLHRPKRLIGFYSTQNIQQRERPRRNGRAIAYSSVLVALLAVFSWLLFSRSEVDGTLLRARGTSYIFRPDGSVSNLYSLELINKSSQTDLSFTLEPEGREWILQLVNQVHVVQKGATAQLNFFLTCKPEQVKSYKTNIKIRVMTHGKNLKTLKTTFVAPPSE